MKKLIIFSFLVGLFSAISHADVSNTLRQFTAPCELNTLDPQAQDAIANDLNMNIRQGFKLVALTKVEKPGSAVNTCVYTFVRQ